METCAIAAQEAACVIVVVAKCPTPGQCKTRLMDRLGPDGSAALAQAMLSDVLSTLSRTVSGCHDVT
jgi:glycosyltransferase A (GT-A) superfamily protein (DUF2064 family)